MCCYKPDWYRIFLFSPTLCPRCAVNKLKTEPTNIYLSISVRRVPPHFTIRPEAKYEVKNGADLNITCVAVGSPMPFVKWREGARDLTPDNELPIGKNVLELSNIRDTSNYTCVAASKLGIIETHTVVKVQGEWLSGPIENVTEMSQCD